MLILFRFSSARRKISWNGQFKTCKIRIPRNVQFNSNTARLTRYMSTVKQWNQSQFDLSAKSVTFQSTFKPNATFNCYALDFNTFVYNI